MGMPTGYASKLGVQPYFQVRELFPRRLSAHWPEPSRFFEVQKYLVSAVSASKFVDLEHNLHPFRIRIQ